MGKALLDLSTLEQPTISIDKQDYSLMRPEDFGLRESVRLERLRKTVAAVMNQTGEIADDEVLAMADALDELVRMVLPSLPDDVFGKLRDGQKLKIVEAFSTLVTPGVRATPTATANPSIGVSGSPG
jgi:hypothetical protein